VRGLLETRIYIYIYIYSVSPTNLILTSVYPLCIVRSVEANCFVYSLPSSTLGGGLALLISCGVYHHPHVAIYIGGTTSLVAHYPIIELRLLLPVSVFHILIFMKIEPPILLSSEVQRSHLFWA
jgi:hypothetical protein